MAILRHPAETALIHPDGAGAGQPAYRLKIPTVYDRAALRRAVAARGGRRRHGLDLLALLRADLKMLLAEHPDAQAGFDALLDASAAAWDALRLATTPDEIEGAFAALGLADAALAPIAAKVAEAGGPYAAALGDNAAWPLLWGAECARRMVLGWTDWPGECRRDHDGLTDAALAAIPDRHLIAIGEEVERLARPTAGEEKN